MGNDFPHLSRLGLGTAQFGLDYGINNPTGKVSYPQALKILEIACRYNINFLDTSRGYGTSEDVLGRAFRELGLEFIVSTKLDLPDNFRDLSDREIIEHSKTSLYRSLETLRLDSIPIYLLHFYDYKTYRDGLIWNYVLEEMTKGPIRYPGVSIGGGPEEALACLEDSAVRVLQIPFNVFDQRWERAGVFQACAERNVILFSRSSYVQGLLLMEPDEAAVKVPVSLEFKKKLAEIAAAFAIPLKEMALRYVLGKEGLTSTIVGLDSPEQLQENLSILAGGPLDDQISARIESTYQNAPDELVNPGLWNIQYPPAAT